MPNEELMYKRNSDGSISQLMTAIGRTVVEKIAHNAVAITNTANNEVVVDVSDLIGEKALMVSSSLDQSATITVYAESVVGGITYAGSLLGAQTLTAGGRNLYGISIATNFATNVSKYRVRVACSVAPSTGSITTLVSGVQG